MSKTVKITENELVDLIDKIVNETVVQKKKQWIAEQKKAQNTNLLESKIAKLEAKVKQIIKEESENKKFNLKDSIEEAKKIAQIKGFSDFEHGAGGLAPSSLWYDINTGEISLENKGIIFSSWDEYINKYGVKYFKKVLATSGYYLIKSFGDEKIMNEFPITYKLHKMYEDDYMTDFDY
jgi:hypothetical protein